MLAEPMRSTSLRSLRPAAAKGWRVFAALCWVALMAGAVVAVDRVAMFTWLEDERLFLADVLHRPKPDGVEFNEHGVRDARRLSAFRESDFNLVVLGDSFVFGFLLKPYQAIPQQMQRMLRRSHPDLAINVVNFGYVSSSPYLALAQLRDFGAAYHPDLVLLCLDMTDFHDDIKYELYERKPGAWRLLDFVPSLFLGAKGAADALGLHEAIFGYPSDRFFIVNRPLEQSRRHLASVQRNLDAIDAYAREVLGARFALAILPRPFQYSAEESRKSWESDRYTPLGPFALEPFRYFEQLQGERDYPIHSLLPAFQQTEVFPTAFKSDPHWNADGARVAAEALVRFVEEAGLLGAPAPEPRPGRIDQPPAGAP
jgi:hypothetical protein